MKRNKPIQRRTPLKATRGLPRRSPPPRTRKTLLNRGRRGKRLAPGDRAQEQAAHGLPCVCGCGAELEPKQIARAHLVRRAVESTRNEDCNNLPACWWLGEWLDHTPEGVQCKRSLWATASRLGRRLEAGNVQPLLRMHGYYTWRKKAGG